MKKLLFIALFLGNYTISFSQKLENPSIDLKLIAQVNQGNSYVTFPIDIGSIEPLIFEGNVIPNFMIRKNKESRLMAVLTPQIIIRMYNEFSLPVKTPSYMPQITMYYLVGNKSNKNLMTFFGRFAHHSNGQRDDTLLADGSVNLESGNFSTNYLEFGGIVTSLNKNTNAILFLKSSFEYHPENETHILLGGKYSRFRWNSEFSAFKLPREKSKEKKKPNISLDVKTTWLFGDLAGTPTFSMDRLQASVTFSYFPNFLEEIGFFVQFYQGKDYYNIYFDQNRTMLRFGIMTDKLRF